MTRERRRSRDEHLRRHRHNEKHPKRHENEKSHRKSSRRDSRSKSIEKQTKSSTFINEILHNSSAKNALKKNENLLQNMINVFENDADSNNNMETSYTPPLPVETKFKDSAIVKVLEPPPEDTKQKKKGVLDLPMPPKIIFKAEAKPKIHLENDQVNLW